MNLKSSFRYVQCIAGLVAVFAVVLSAGGCKETTNGPASESLSDPAVQPMVLSTLPLSGSTGPFSFYNRGDGANKPHFVLTFNKLMYKGSFTSKSFRVQGFDFPATARIEGLYYYGPLKKSASVNSIYYDNVLSFTIIDSAFNYTIPYRIGRQYTVTLDSTVEDINGNHLLAQYTFTYTPEPYFRVVGMYPKNGTKDVYLNFTPYIYFNSSVNASIFDKVQLTPVPSGTWRLDSYDSSEIYFDHQQPFPYSTNFTLLLDGSATDAELHQIDRSYTSAFSTMAFLPTYIYPRNGSTKVDLNTGISVEFSGLIDMSTVQSGFNLSPATAGTFNLSSQSTTFGFSPLNGLRQNTAYTITITPSLKASDGTPAVLSTSTFTTGPFTVSGYPYDGSTNVPRSSSIQVNTNSKLDGTTVGPAFTISPATAGNISFADGYTYFTWNPSTQLAANTKYTVTISSALATKLGDHLMPPYIFSFTTGN